MADRWPPRLIAWYAASVGSLAFVPYLAVVLSHSGLEDGDVVTVLLLLPVCRLVGGPLWSFVADRTGRADLVVRVLALSSAAAGFWLATASTSAALALGIAAYSLSRAGQFPIVDALTVRSLPDGARGYPRVRMWGSVAFLCAVLPAGALRDTWPSAPLLIGGALLAATALVTLTLPRPPPLEARADWAGMRTLLTHPELRALMAIALLHGVTLTTYDNLFPLHVERSQLPGRVEGMGIALGVAVEVGVLLGGARLLDRYGPRTLLLVGVASGLPRWLLTGLVPDPTVLVLAQGLHGLGFGAFWIASVELIARRSPPELLTSAQSLLPASAFGGGYIGAMLIARVLLEPLGTSGLFTTMASASALAIGGALWLHRRGG